MKVVKLRLAALTIVLVCSLGAITQAQQRRPSRRPTSHAALAPLTAEQKEEVADVVKRASELEITYNYHPDEYANAAFDLASTCLNLSETLPAGPLKNLVYEMWNANRAASLMYGVYMPSRKSAFQHFLEGEIAEGKGTDPIPDIVREYKLERLNPYQAQRELFGYALIVSQRVQILLSGSPTARRAQPPNRGGSATPASRADVKAGDEGAGGAGIDQVERQAQQLSGQLDELAAGPNAKTAANGSGADGEWAFPKQGMQGHYNETIKGPVYDLGDGVYAGHMKLDTPQGPADLVLVIFSAPVNEQVKRDFDLAILAASKVSNLPLEKPLPDVALKRENDYEYLFRTTQGKIVSVTLGHDRKTALARFK